MSEVTIIYGYLEDCPRIEAIEALVKLQYAQDKKIRINKNIAWYIMQYLEKDGSFYGLKKDVALPQLLRYHRIEMTLADFWRVKNIVEFIRKDAKEPSIQFVFKVVFHTCHCCRSANRSSLLHFVDSDGTDVMLCKSCIDSKSYGEAVGYVRRERHGL